MALSASVWWGLDFEGLAWVAVTMAAKTSNCGCRGEAIVPMPHGSASGSWKRWGSMRRHKMSPIVTPNCICLKLVDSSNHSRHVRSMLLGTKKLTEVATLLASVDTGPYRLYRRVVEWVQGCWVAGGGCEGCGFEGFLLEFAGGIVIWVWTALAKAGLGGGVGLVVWATGIAPAGWRL